MWARCVNDRLTIDNKCHAVVLYESKRVGGSDGNIADEFPNAGAHQIGSNRVDRLFKGNVFDASHAAIVALVAASFTPMVVNVTSALDVVHAAAPMWQVDRARLAAVAPVALPAIALVVTHP